MIRTRSLALSLTLSALALTPAACGDDGGSTPDARRPSPDAAAAIDAAPTIDAEGAADANTDAGADAGADASADAMPATGIAAARAAADGATNVAIVDALVTYKKAAVGNDAAGFFIQKDQTGPALFIAVDPTTLATEPAVGDDVDLTVTSMTTSGAMRQADGISGFTINTNGNSVAGLAQDLTAVTDLVSAIGDYEAELSSINLTIKADFTGAGSGHVQGVADSTGVVGSTDLTLRIPTTIQDTYGFVTDCTVNVTSTPMWRFGARAQVSVYSDSEFMATCPAPTIVSAVPTSATELVVTLSRAIDAASVTTVATQFTFDNGLAATAGTVAGRSITLTTTPQTTGQAYVVTIAASVLDVLGGSAAGTAVFSGFGAPEATCDDGLDDDADGFVDCLDTDCSANAACMFLAQPYIWEVDADETGGDTTDFIEIRNMSTTALDLTSYYIVLLNGSNSSLSYAAYQLTGTHAAGDLFIIGQTAVAGADITFSGMQNGADGVLLVQCATCTDAATDFPTGTDPGEMTTFTTDGGQTATKIDGLAYDSSDADIPLLMSKLGVTVQYNDTNTESNQRTSLTGFAAATPTPNATAVQP